MHRNGHSAPIKHGSRLGQARRGFRGRVHAIDVTHGHEALAHAEREGLAHAEEALAHAEREGLTGAEIESRLIELGFVEGASVEILHEGTFGRDPIAVRVNHATIALRRREAMAILVS